MDFSATMHNSLQNGEKCPTASAVLPSLFSVGSVAECDLEANAPLQVSVFASGPQSRPTPF